MEFYHFLNNKHREIVKKLKTLRELFEHSGFEVIDNLNHHDDPHIFVKNSEGRLSFEGVRVYIIGNEVAYRIQKQSNTQPYGRAYLLPVEQIYEELLQDDDITESEAQDQLVKAISSEIKRFFKKSQEAEKDSRFVDDPLNQIIMRATGTDYADQVTRRLM